MTDPAEIDVRRLRLMPGDVVVVSFPATWRAEDMAHAVRTLAAAVAAAGHGDVPVVMKLDEVDVSVVGPGDPGGLTTTGGGRPR